MAKNKTYEVMKKKELPELKLNKRTIANLNNMEMRYVNGGGGDDDDISRKNCEVEDPAVVSEIIEKAKKIILSQIYNCKID